MSASRWNRRATPTPSRWLLGACVAASAATLMAACSHEVESPTLTVGALPGAITPEVACTEHRPPTNVVVSGGNFTPLPTKVLSDDKAQLVLPKIELIETQNILDETADQGTLDPTPLVIPDSAEQPETSLVHYIDDRTMSFDLGRPKEDGTTEPLVYPTGEKLGGVYTVRITNPDGKPAAPAGDWVSGLALVPPPIITELVPPAICLDQSDQTVTVHGRYFLRITDAHGGVLVPGVTINGQTYLATSMDGCTELVGTFASKLEVCTSLTIVIPTADKEKIPPGEHDVTVTNPAPADCTSPGGSIKIRVNEPPRVDSVNPLSLCSGGGKLDISGLRFDQVGDAKPRVELRPKNDPAATVVHSSAVSCFNASQAEDCSNLSGVQLSVQFGPGAIGGVNYDVVVINPDGCEDRPLPHKEIQGKDGPILFFVDPFVVPNQFNVRVTLYSTIIEVSAQVPVPRAYIIPAGQTAPITELLDPQIVEANPPFKHLQATVPQGMPAGKYDVYLEDGSGCTAAVLPEGLTVAAEERLAIREVIPPFGDESKQIAVAIFRDTTAAPPKDVSFAATPRVFLNRSGATSEPAIQLQGVVWLHGDQLTALVPPGTAPGDYDVIVVNPEPGAEVGILPAGYRSLPMDAPPPEITSVVPASFTTQVPQTLTIDGTHFRPGATVSLECQLDGAPVAPPTLGPPNGPTCDVDQNCTITIDVTGNVIQFEVCVVTVTNTDGSYAIFSAVGTTGPSLNLPPTKPGAPLNTGRRGLVAAAAKATATSRFLYAIGGDGGAANAASPFATVESAPVDIFGQMGGWSNQRYDLGAGRAFSGVATVGRYIYVVGGTDGTGPLASAVRAQVLSPAEAPRIAGIDLKLDPAGLDKGTWYYKVSAFYDPADATNPGGESLPSDEFILRVPAGVNNKKIQVILDWDPPKDKDGNDLPGVAGYHVYRTPVVDGTSGGEVRLATVSGAGTTLFTDDGTSVPDPTKTPLPLGSTGTWAPLAPMAEAREGVAVAAGPDPVDTTKWYVYAFFGRGSGGLLGSYEILPITIEPSGQQTTGAWIMGAGSSTGARWRHQAWQVDRTVRADIGAVNPRRTFVFVGGGHDTAGGFVNHVERGEIAAGGDFVSYTGTGEDFSSGVGGYAAFAAAQQLFVLGGGSGAGAGTPATKGVSSEIVNANGGLAQNSWNAGLSLSVPRIYPGSTVQSAFAFFVGGKTNTDEASTSVEYVVW